MPYSLVVKEAAINEARDAYFFYEEQQDGLGDRFYNALNQRLEQLTENPKYYSYVSADREKTMRDVKLYGFPYVVIYDIEGFEVVVYSIKSTYKRSNFH